VLYAQALPTFDSTLSDEDSETLLSSLAVSRLRVPLMLDFFAYGRVGTLLNVSLQRLFACALFELGKLAPSNPNSDAYPNDSPAAMSTRSGVLSEEAAAAPQLLAAPLTSILRAAATAASSMNHRAPFVSLLLFLTLQAARVLAFIGHAGGDAADAGGSAAAKAAASLLGTLEGAVLPLLRRWTDEASNAHMPRLAATILRHVAFAHAVFARFRSELLDLECALGGLAFCEAWEISLASSQVRSRRLCSRARLAYWPASILPLLTFLAP
jgi:hypothetical protein